MDASKPKSYFRLQSVKKVEVQEALLPLAKWKRSLNFFV